MRKLKLKDKGRNLHHERMPAESKRRRLQKNWGSQASFVKNNIEVENDIEVEDEGRKQAVKIAKDGARWG